jgi:hypothetical protein
VPPTALAGQQCVSQPNTEIKGSRALEDLLSSDGMFCFVFTWFNVRSVDSY